MNRPFGFAHNVYREPYASYDGYKINPPCSCSHYRKPHFGHHRSHFIGNEQRRRYWPMQHPQCKFI